MVDFWATWCGPCKMVAPMIAQIAAERDDVQVAKVDVDQVPDVASEFGIAAIPTVVYFKDGKGSPSLCRRPVKSRLFGSSSKPVICMMKKLSIVVPVFNEQENIHEFYRRVTEVMAPLSYDYELLFIDDGSVTKARP